VRVCSWLRDTCTDSRTERKVVLPFSVSTIDLDGGLCDCFISSRGVDIDGLSSDNIEPALSPCIVGVLNQPPMLKRRVTPELRAGGNDLKM